MRKFLPMAVFALLAQNSVAEPLSYGVVDRHPGPDGAYDYITVDNAANRVFVGRDTGVMTIDLTSRAVTPAFVVGKGVAGVLLLPDGVHALATERAGDSAILFDRQSGAVIARFPTGKGPDGSTFDAASGLAFVFNSSSADATVIDIAKRTVVATIPVGGKPEAGVPDGKGRVYLNVEDRSDIAVIDIASRKVTRRIPIAGCEEPTGLALDAKTQMLISACHNGVAVLTDIASGSAVASVPIGKGADGALFDSQRRVAFVPCRDGTLSMFRVTEAGTVQDVTVLPTQEGARTATLEPVSGRVYLPAVHYLIGADGKRQRAPGTFVVLAVAPLTKAK